MVLRSSISNTRKLFPKTIENFKSFFSNNDTYHKLPKTPKNTFINNNHHHHHHHPNPNINKPLSSSSIHKQFQPKPRDYVTTNRALTLQPRRGDRDETLFFKPKVDLVCRKLKEMEKIMNDDIISDEHYVSDVREFLHCYSLLRYAAYLDVVEHFSWRSILISLALSLLSKPERPYKHGTPRWSELDPTVAKFDMISDCYD